MASTEAPGAVAAVRDAPTGAGFDPDRPARLSPEVALRPEPFGALAYHYGTRRLLFVRSEGLVRVLEGLGDHASAREAARALVGADEVGGVLAALARLHDAGVVGGR